MCSAQKINDRLRLAPIFANTAVLIGFCPRWLPSTAPVVKPRPVYLDLLHIRQPLPAVVSILHRISGVLLFLVGFRSCCG
jgi:hypothetical protein